MLLCLYWLALTFYWTSSSSKLKQTPARRIRLSMRVPLFSEKPNSSFSSKSLWIIFFLPLCCMLYTGVSDHSFVNITHPDHDHPSQLCKANQMPDWGLSGQWEAALGWQLTSLVDARVQERAASGFSTNFPCCWNRIMEKLFKVSFFLQRRNYSRQTSTTAKKAFGHLCKEYWNS